MSPNANNMKRAIQEICGNMSKACFGRMSPFAYSKDRRTTGKTALWFERMNTALMTGACLYATNWSTPLSILQGLAATAVLVASSRYFTARYSIPVSRLMKQAKEEGLSTKEARAHTTAVRKASNGFNAPMQRIEHLGLYMLAQEVPQHRGHTFLGKTTNQFRKSFVQAVENISPEMKEHLIANNTSVKGAETVIHILESYPNAEALPSEAKHTAGLFCVEGKKGEISIHEFPFVEKSSSEPVCARDFLDNDVYRLSMEKMGTIAHHEAGHAFDHTLASAGNRCLSNSPFFLKTLQDEIEKTGQAPAILEAHKNNGYPATHESLARELFARYFAYKHGFKDGLDTGFIDSLPQTFGLYSKVIDDFYDAHKKGPDALFSYFENVSLLGAERTGKNIEAANFYASRQMVERLMTTRFKNTKIISTFKNRTSRSALYKYSKLYNGVLEKDPDNFIAKIMLAITTDALKENAPRGKVARPRPLLRSATATPKHSRT